MPKKKNPAIAAAMKQGVSRRTAFRRQKKEREAVLDQGKAESAKLPSPGKGASSFPFYRMLPVDDPIKLLKWQIYVKKRCIADYEFRRAILSMCQYDYMFRCITLGSIL